MTAASANIRGLAADLAGAGQTVNSKADELLNEFGQKVMDLGQSYAPIKTGALKTSISMHKVALTVTIGPHVHYGAFQEFGTGSKGEFPGNAYTIKPKLTGGLLAFQVNGQTVYARSVKHPGVKAHPYMRKAFSEALGPFLPALAAAGAASITKGPNAT